MTEADLAAAMAEAAATERGHWINAEMVDNCTTRRLRGGGRRNTVIRTPKEYMECAKRGMTMMEACAYLGVSKGAGEHMKRTHKVPFKDGRRKG
jgi:hypothetical protein